MGRALAFPRGHEGTRSLTSFFTEVRAWLTIRASLRVCRAAGKPIATLGSGSTKLQRRRMHHSLLQLQQNLNHVSCSYEVIIALC